MWYLEFVAFGPRIAVERVILLEDSDWNASMPRHTGLCSETIKKRDDTHDNHEMPLCPWSKPCCTFSQRMPDILQHISPPLGEKKKKKKWKLLGCFRLCDPMDPTRLLCPWDFPGKNTGVGCHSLLQGIFSNQGSNLGLPHCRQSLYLVSDQGSPSPLGEPEVTIGTGIHFPSTWPWAETSGNKTLLLCLSFSF